MELFKLKVGKGSKSPSFEFIDLTNKYSQAYENLDWDYGDKFETMLNYNKSFQEIFRKTLFDAAGFLERIPIYLVDTNISNTAQWYEGEKIYVPFDNSSLIFPGPKRLWQ